MVNSCYSNSSFDGSRVHWRKKGNFYVCIDIYAKNSSSNKYYTLHDAVKRIICEKDEHPYKVHRVQELHRMNCYYIRLGFDI